MTGVVNNDTVEYADDAKHQTLFTAEQMTSIATTEETHEVRAHSAKRLWLHVITGPPTHGVGAD